MNGRLCRLTPVSRNEHSEDLYRAYALDPEGRNWTYMPYGPFATLAEFQSWIDIHCLGDDPCFYAVIDQKSGNSFYFFFCSDRCGQNFQNYVE